jgi:hypothetical protein
LPAQHFPTHATISSISEQAINDDRGLLSREDAAFPVTFLSSTNMLIIDTGASITITPSKEDFVGDVKPVQPTVLQGIASGLQVAGIGTASYTFMVPNGDHISISLPNTLYVPACSVRLLCQRHVAASTGVAGDGFTSQKDWATLQCHGIDLPVAYHQLTNLPILYSVASTSLTASAVLGFPAEIIKTTTPQASGIPQVHLHLTPSQRTKLLWHERCNHVNSRL